MTPLQKVAMGLVIVVLRAPFGGFDALADPVGWGLVVAGLLPGAGLRERLPGGGGPLLGCAAVAGLVAVPLWLPAVDERLAPSGQWALSLPQTLFCFLLCAVLAQAVTGRRQRWFAGLRWLFAAVALGPVLVYGGHVDALASPVAVLAVVANLVLVYQLFAVSRRPELGGPAPDDVPTRDENGPSPHR